MLPKLTFAVLSFGLFTTPAIHAQTKPSPMPDMPGMNMPRHQTCPA